MPRIESDIHQKYKDQAYEALAIHAGEEVRNAVESVRTTGITFPLLVDIDNAVVARYNRLGEGVTLFPLGYLIDKKGIIRHVYKDIEPTIPSLQADIEALIAEDP